MNLSLKLLLMWKRAKNILIMTKLGLLGKGIQHSKSKSMYEGLLEREVDYHLFDYENNTEIPPLFEFFKKVDGLSITAPYKEHFLADVEVSPEVKKLQAINCIRKTTYGFEATNTDYLACQKIIESLQITHEVNIFILGRGAMARVLCQCFDEKNLNYKILHRDNTDFSFLDFTAISADKKYLIINCCAREYSFSGKIDDQLYLFWDLNYSVQISEDSPLFNNKLYCDGLELLKEQAAFALKFWNIK